MTKYIRQLTGIVHVDTVASHPLPMINFPISISKDPQSYMPQPSFINSPKGQINLIGQRERDVRWNGEGGGGGIVVYRADMELHSTILSSVVKNPNFLFSSQGYSVLFTI